MRIQEFGSAQRETILLLHGGGLSWWNYRKEAEFLESDYHVVLPILDGHAGSDRPFTSIEGNAAELIAYIDEQCRGRVLLIGGLSLGAQILLEMLSQRSDICRFALAESACVIPSKLTNALIGPVFGSSYGLIRNRQFAKLQFRSLHMDDCFFAEYYRDTCAVTKADMIAFLRANTSYALKDSIADTTAQVHVLVGGKENKAMRKSAELLKQSIPGCTERVLPGLYHGEFSINYPDRYAAYLRAMLDGK